MLTGFYRYCVEEQLLEHSPAVHVRRPKVSQESTRIGLDRNELSAFLVHAGLSGGNDHVLACLLGLNALRVSEACGADLDDLAIDNGHRTLRIVGKGAQPALIPLAPRTARAIDAAIGERAEGPLVARPNGTRLDRHAAGRIVRGLAKRAGITKPISPHSLRHAAITAAAVARGRRRGALRRRQEHRAPLGTVGAHPCRAPRSRWNQVPAGLGGRRGRPLGPGSRGGERRGAFRCAGQRAAKATAPAVNP